MIVGNKTDLKHLRGVKTEDANQFAESNNLAFIEASALEAYNVENAFNKIISGILSII